MNRIFANLVSIICIVSLYGQPDGSQSDEEWSISFQELRRAMVQPKKESLLTRAVSQLAKNGMCALDEEITKQAKLVPDDVLDLLAPEWYGQNFNALTKLQMRSNQIVEKYELRSCLGFGMSMVVSPTGDVITGSRSNPVYIRDANGKFKDSIDKGVSAIAVTPIGDIITGSLEGVIQIRDQAGNLKYAFNDKIKRLSAIVVAPNGAIITGSSDGIIQIWDQSGKLKHAFAGAPEGIVQMAMLPNGDIVTGSCHNKVQIWDLVTGELKNTVTDYRGPIRGMTVLPNGDIVTADDKIRIWDSLSGKLKHTSTGKLKYASLIYDEHINAIATLPNGDLVIKPNDGKARIWQLSLEHLLRNKKIALNKIKLGDLCELEKSLELQRKQQQVLKKRGCILV